MSSRLFHTPTPIFHHQARSLTRLVFHSSKVKMLSASQPATPLPQRSPAWRPFLYARAFKSGPSTKDSLHAAVGLVFSPASYASYCWCVALKIATLRGKCVPLEIISPMEALYKMS